MRKKRTSAWIQQQIRIKTGITGGSLTSSSYVVQVEDPSAGPLCACTSCPPASSRTMTSSSGEDAGAGVWSSRGAGVGSVYGVGEVASAEAAVVGAGKGAPVAEQSAKHVRGNTGERKTGRCSGHQVWGGFWPRKGVFWVRCGGHNSSAALLHVAYTAITQVQPKYGFDAAAVCCAAAEKTTENRIVSSLAMYHPFFYIRQALGVPV